MRFLNPLLIVAFLCEDSNAKLSTPQKPSQKVDNIRDAFHASQISNRIHDEFMWANSSNTTFHNITTTNSMNPYASRYPQESMLHSMDHVHEQFQASAMNTLENLLNEKKKKTPEENPESRGRTLNNHGSEEYQPLRIKIITNNLEDLLENSQFKKMLPKEIDLPSTVEFLTKSVLPDVQSFLSQLLSVVPYQEPAIDISDNVCFDQVQDIPNDIIKNGVPDADLVLFAVGDICGARSIAAAAPCELSRWDLRPSVGVIMFCLDNDIMEPNDENLETVKQIAIHEITHVLGMNSDIFPFFIDRETKEPFLDNARARWVNCADNIPRRVLAPAQEVVQEDFSTNGARHFEIVTPTVKQVVRNQFGCQTINGARLENQPTSRTDCYGSHWDERLFFTESLSAIYSPEAKSNTFSPLTLALLEDSGWYTGNYSLTTKSTFGHGAGCDFVTENCIVDGELPPSSKGFFCNSVSSIRDDRLEVMCTPSHQGIGYCDLFDYNDEKLSTNMMPSDEFRYFEDNKAPLFFDRADFCPMVIPFQAQINCQMDSKGRKVDDHMCVNVESPDEFLVAQCVEYICNADLNKLQMKLTDDDLLTCDFDFQMIDDPIFKNTKLECPRLAVVCPDLTCPANCSGKGICDFNNNPPKCNCFDPLDKSSSCNNEIVPTSTPTRTPTNTPTSAPTSMPTVAPTDSPTSTPTNSPTDNPTMDPTVEPTNTPTTSPSKKPTNPPTTFITSISNEESNIQGTDAPSKSQVLAIDTVDVSPSPQQPEIRSIDENENNDFDIKFSITSSANRPLFGNASSSFLQTGLVSFSMITIAWIILA